MSTVEFDLSFATAADIAAATTAGVVTARAVAEHTIATIQAHDRRLRAVIDVHVDDVIAQADALDARRASGASLGPLHGVPVLVKAENHIAGHVTRHGSAAASRVEHADSAVVAALRAAGAVIVGTTAMSEFGLWPFTETHTFGVTRNPWNTDRSPAGSSGGSGAAVAAGYVPIAIGGDSGGSIRLPAAWCGLVGVKTQRGRVSTGPYADALTALGVVGPLTRTVLDTALALDVLDAAKRADVAAPDRFEAEPFRLPLAAAAARGATRSVGEPGGSPRLRVGVAIDAADPAVTASPEVVDGVRRVAAALAELGHEVTEVVLDIPDLGNAHIPQIAAGVAAAVDRVGNPLRNDGRTRSFIEQTSFMLAPEITAGAEAEGARIAEQVLRVFDDVDVVITPVAPTTALPAGQLEGTDLMGASARIAPLLAYTTVWNVAGNPAGAVPAGWSADGLPLSAQLIVRPHDEPTLIEVAAQLESLGIVEPRRPDLGALETPVVAARLESE